MKLTYIQQLLTLLLDRNAKHRKSKKPVSRPLHNQFTSTPRKSRVYFDQRRHLEDFIQTGGRGGGTSGDANQHNNNGNINLIVAPTKCMQSEKFTKWRQSILPSTDSCTTSDSNSPCVAEKDDSVFVETVEKVFIQKRKDRRSSFILRGNMFAKRKRDANNSSARELLRNKAKHQRSLHFNKYRKSLCGERYVKLRKSILDRLSSINPSSANDVESYEERNRDSIQWGTRDSIEAHMLNGDSEMFENLLTLKKSNAPFEVTEMNLTPASSSRQTSLKTLYSGSVIKNRKIPHVNKTPVGDTSGSSKKNQITIVHILHNWDKLDIFVKTLLLICFFILALNILLGIRLAG